jgi:hypothetical protein
MPTSEVTLRRREAPARTVTVVLEGARREGGPRIAMQGCTTNVSVLRVGDEQREKYTAATWTGVCASGILYAARADRLENYEIRIRSIAGVLAVEDMDAVATCGMLAAAEALGFEGRPGSVMDGWERV